jgi:hypothetical protein
MPKFLDTGHPMFRPLWVRVLIVAFAAGWGIFELATGSPFWAVIFLALAAYAAWGFFVDFHPDGGGQP